MSDLSKWILASMKSSSGESPTSHPVGSVPDGTKPATEGARSSENAADAAAQTPGQPAATASVASDKPSVGGTSGTPANDGTGAAMTGDLAKDKTKPSADDPGTAHAAKASVFATIAETKSAGLAILASLASASPVAAKEAAVAAPAPAPVAPAAPAVVVPPVAPAVAPAADAVKEAADKEAAAKEAAAKEAGARAADAAISALGVGTEGDAVAAFLGDIVKSAEYDAELTVGYLAGMAKQAEQEAAMPPGGMPPGGMPPEGMPPGAAGAPGEGGGADITPEQLMQLLEESGVPPEQLLQSLVESGEIPPEVAQQIMAEAAAAAEQAAAGGGGGAGAGGPPMAPPAEPPPAPPAEQAAPPPPAEKAAGSCEAPSKSPAIAPNDNGTKVVGADADKAKAAKSSMLKAALRALEGRK